MSKILFLVNFLFATTSAQYTWTSCPPQYAGSPGFFCAGTTDANGNAKTPTCEWKCTTTTFLLDRGDPNSEKVTSFIRRIAPISGPTKTTMWGFPGGPGNSAAEFVPFFEYMVTTDSSMTGYLMDYRGIGPSSGLAICSKSPPYRDPYNETIMAWQDACIREILSNSGGPERIRYFNTYESARDVRDVMDTILTTITGSTAGIYCSSYGTFFCNTLLQLVGKIDAVVFDGPIAATRWSIENNARTKSMVTLESIRMCVEGSDLCKSKIGSSGYLHQMINDAVNDLSLPCVQKLPWLKAANGKYWLSVFNDGFSDTDKKALLAPLYWRLFRCSDSDVTQLNYLYTKNMRDIGMYPYKTSAQNVPGGTVPGPIDPNEGHTLATVNADCYTQGDLNGGWVLSLNDINLLHTKATSIEYTGADSFSASSRDVSGWPTWRGNALSRQYYQGAKSVPGRTAKIHMIVGTLDHNTPIGQSDWIRHEYGTNVQSELYIVPYATHGVVAQFFAKGLPCAANFVLEVLSLNLTANPGTCFSVGLPEPDWNGTTAATQDQSLAYFGTKDLWNAGLVPVTGPTPSPGPLGAPIFPTAVPCSSTTCPTCGDCDNNEAVTDATLGLVVTIFVMIAGLYALFFFRREKPLSEKGQGSSSL